MKLDLSSAEGAKPNRGSGWAVNTAAARPTRASSDSTARLSQSYATSKPSSEHRTLWTSQSECARVGRYEHWFQRNRRGAAEGLLTDATPGCRLGHRLVSHAARLLCGNGLGTHE